MKLKYANKEFDVNLVYDETDNRIIVTVDGEWVVAIDPSVPPGPGIMLNRFSGLDKEKFFTDYNGKILTDDDYDDYEYDSTDEDSNWP